MKEPRTKTLLVDGSSLLTNVFEATSRQQWSHPHIHGIYAFLMKVRNQLDMDSYNNLRIVFDGNNRGILRRNIYSDYKISRIKKSQTRTPAEVLKHESFMLQKNKLQDYLTHFCCWYEDVDVEGDDILAHYVFNKLPNEHITIMTGDVDVMFLVGKDVEANYLNKKFKNKSKDVVRYEKDDNRTHMIINHKNFIKFFGYPVENIPTIKTFCGDSSDDIKNIYRLGEKTLFKEFPELLKKPVTVQEILKECSERLKDDSLNKESRKVLTNIVERKTKGVQGDKIIEINERLVNLKNQEFITPQCINNLENSGFLSNKKYKSIDALSLVQKMQADGILMNIKKNYKDMQSFFKPFKKTII